MGLRYCGVLISICVTWSESLTVARAQVCSLKSEPAVALYSEMLVTSGRDVGDVNGANQRSDASR